jgi:plastocyanin
MWKPTSHSNEEKPNVEAPRPNHGPNRKPRRTAWWVAALAAASTGTLAACGGGASGTGPTAAPSTPAATAPSSPGASGAGATSVAAPPTAATADVGILNFKFTPAALTVRVGSPVVWTNKDTVAHTVNFTTDGINSTVLNQNDQFTHTFTTPGTYAYICSIHPFMHGSVIVTT